MEQLGSPAIRHTFREQNQVPDLLTKEGSRKGIVDRTHFLAVSPVFENEAAWTDILGVVFTRKTNVCNTSIMLDNDDGTQGSPGSLYNDVIIYI